MNERTAHVQTVGREHASNSALINDGLNQSGRGESVLADGAGGQTTCAQLFRAALL